MKIGEKQTLTIEKFTDFGAYLVEGELTGIPAKSDEHVLLPKKNLPEDAKKGDKIQVFVYRDSSDRPIATTNIPLITLNEIAVLTVKEVGKIGAFLDWGLEKDLFLPFKEMTGRIEAGDEVFVRCYLDKSQRLCASMKKLYPLLKKVEKGDTVHVEGAEVEARIYEFGHDFGTYVAIEDTYSGMIKKHEDVSNYRIGDVITVAITKVLPDGKCDVSLRKKSYLQMDDDSEKLMEIIESYAGVLPFSEKASAEVIMRETGLSKAAFKRAAGRLYKEKKITITDGVIRQVLE